MPYLKMTFRLLNCSRIVNTYERQLHYQRIHLKRILHTNITSPGKNFSDENVKKKKRRISSYFLDRFYAFVQSYDELLAKRFPKTMSIYRVFMDGFRLFYKDFKEFFRIFHAVQISRKSVDALSRQQLELYHQLPKDIFKLAPILLISAIPFSFYLVLPLIYYFPKQLLSSHFWTLQQKSEFNTAILQKRLKHNRPVFRHLQARLNEVPKPDDREKWSIILGQIGSGVQPNCEQILEVRSLFGGTPYHLEELHAAHVGQLALIHGIRPSIFQLKKVRERGLILKAMDKAIVREGGVEALSTEALKQCCLIRGFNPLNQSNETMANWLREWLTISREVDRNEISLLLHCPILLGYNQPSNWLLIYTYK